MDRGVAVLCAAEIDQLTLFVNAGNRLGFPVSRRYLPDARSIAVVMVNMSPSGFFTQPKKRTIRQPFRFTENAHPGLALFLQYCRLTKVEMQPMLFPILDFIAELYAVGCPSDAYNQEVLHGVTRQINPVRRHAANSDNAEPGLGIGITRQWVVGCLGLRRKGNVIDQRKRL